LKYGYWIDFFSSESNSADSSFIDPVRPMICAEGNLKIIEILPEQIEKKYDDWLTLKDDYFVSFEASYQNLYSVADGWWIGYNCNYSEENQILIRTLYSSGHSDMYQSFENGLVTETVVKHGHIWDTYLGNQPYVYCREDFSHGSKTIYYPDNVLAFSSYYAGLWALIGQSGTDYIDIYSNSSQPVVIDSIHFKNKMIHLSINNDSVLRPLTIKPHDTCRLLLTYFPEPTTSEFEREDTLYFCSSTSPLNYYSLRVGSSCAHLSYRYPANTQVAVRKTAATDYIKISTCSYSKIADRAEVLNAAAKLMDKFWIGFDDPCSVELNIEKYEAGTYRVVFYDYNSKVVFEQGLLIE
jgi:hypothetical protein